MSKTTEAPGLYPCPKHNCGGTLINVFDKRAVLRWSSIDPVNEQGIIGQNVLELYPEEVREQAFLRIGGWLMTGKTDSWIVRAADWPHANNGDLINWKITVFPMDFGDIAGVSLSTKLPSCYFDLTDDDFTLLRLLVTDNTLKEIAVEMHRSESAIDARVKSLKEKLDCKTIAGLAAKAVWCHLVSA